ncbi:MAG: right-handed parallel beta-helix repeat-containing protein, partial [Planktothrix sp.]
KAKKLYVENCQFENFGGAAILNDLSCIGCKIKNNISSAYSGFDKNINEGGNGFLVIGGSGNDVSGNTITGGAQGIVTVDSTKNTQFYGNSISNIRGQHGIYAGSGNSNILFSNNTIKNTNGIGIKVQSFAQAVFGAKDAYQISIIGNSINGCQTGISVSSTSQPSSSLSVNIQANNIRNCRENIILAGNCKNSIISNNIGTLSRSGISIFFSLNIDIENNVIDSVSDSSIRIFEGCEKVKVNENKISQIQNSEPLNCGIVAVDDPYISITNNTIYCRGGRIGIFAPFSSQSDALTLDISDNKVYESGETDIRMSGIGGRFENNIFSTSLSLPGTVLGKQSNYYYSKGLPTTGSYKVGDIAENSSKEGNILLWMRKTNGTSNNLNTDWVPISGKNIYNSDDIFTSTRRARGEGNRALSFSNISSFNIDTFDYVRMHSRNNNNKSEYIQGPDTTILSRKYATGDSSLISISRKG